MKIKNILMGLLILFVLCSISSVGAIELNDTQSQGNDFVTISNDNIQSYNSNEDNLSLASGSFSQLKDQIDKASDGSVIKLNQDYSLASDSGISIDKSLTINGQGHTIDCANLKNTFLFKSTSGMITLENLIIKNNKMAQYGTIYITDSAQYTINNCTFIDNSASYFGGAIYNGAKDNDLTIKNSKFINNKIFLNEGGAVYSRGNLVVENSYFEKNKAYLDGGAISCDGYVDLINTKFISNDAFKEEKRLTVYGGAVSSKKGIYVENCLFSNNSADNGGALFSRGDVIVKNSSFNKNIAFGSGGAIYVDSSNAVISTSTFVDNAARQIEGGAVFSSKWTHIETSTFLRNTAKAKGGAISTSYIQFGNDVFFTNNSANDHGGAVYTDYISSNVYNINFN